MFKGNNASMQTDFGQGEHGYQLITSTYALIAPGAPFVAPAHPGAQPIIEADTTAVTSGNTLRTYAEIARNQREWCNLEGAGKSSCSWRSKSLL